MYNPVLHFDSHTHPRHSPFPPPNDVESPELETQNGGRRVGVRAEAGPLRWSGRRAARGRRTGPEGLEGCAVPDTWEQDLCWPPARAGPGPRSDAVPEGLCRRTGPGRRTGPRSRAGGPGRRRAGGPGRCRAGGPDDKKCILWRVHIQQHGRHPPLDVEITALHLRVTSELVLLRPLHNICLCPHTAILASTSLAIPCPTVIPHAKPQTLDCQTVAEPPELWEGDWCLAGDCWASGLASASSSCDCPDPLAFSATG